MPVGSQSRRRSGKAALVVTIVVAVVAVGALAWFGEPIGAALKLRTWDKETPAKTVLGFLKAAKDGDQKTAQSFIDSPGMQVESKKGKWIGFSQAVGSAGFTEYRIADLVPKEIPGTARVEFITVGDGAAEVWVPGRDGKEIKYRLEMKSAGWKIKELGGGRRK